MKIILSFILLFTLTTNQKDIEDYHQEIPNTHEGFDMLAIPGGEFLFGSPESESLRKENEGPQVKVEVSPFWMAKYETTWDLYLIYQNSELEIDKNLVLDGISRPTKPYVEMSFGQGKNGGFPVCNVTQYAARSFCEWLYKKTGVFYRLPTEAEWEYAARAGSTTAWHFGDDVSQLDDYAWSYANSDGAYALVGEKKPNEWGLYDMYGNVSEWTSDQYKGNLHSELKNGVKDPYFEPTTLYPHTIKGGNWDDDADALRSAARTGSTERLKRTDPQIPKSDWWLTDAPFLGFRLVRPAVQPSKAEIQKYFAPPPKDK
ncbi:formylglycine-generating enzyme family protein [Arcticibacterium luteifluviistationis]|uniref:Sulfatase-modifying factor protein n=1 Tax=Arcticibacterium luteifluviistationis TaxID=1784714 RepID=A0A2Z4GBD4_9BACT|nr:SUMF1/EgtB/PvdO family nonheme iron enzyme [Arcticibacterium luteifluviistationis]AWV98592.1 sulfatase-modifying factor protein [Arcticibacterium luteifluviistationis]